MSEPRMKYPGPRPSPLTAPYWAAAAEHRLTIQRCGGCKSHVFYPRRICPHCWSSNLDWVEVSGRANVASFVGAYKPGHPAFIEDAPYVIALVDLEEGPRMLTNIIDASPEDDLIGRAVTVVYEEQAGATLPRFCLHEKTP